VSRAAEHQVEFDAGADLAAAQAAPGRPCHRHEAERRDRGALLHPDGQGERPGLGRRSVERGRGQSGGIDPEQGDVSRRVAPDQACRGLVATRQGDRDLALLGERLIGSDDQAGAPDEAAGPRAVGMDADDASCRLCHQTGERGGEGLER